MNARPVPTLCSLLLLACAGSTALLAQPVREAPAIHLVWMGGSDCPPCVAWRALELPKLEKSAGFRGVTFSYVPKVIRSSVPPRVFLPAEVKPHKEKLDYASSGRGGSPQAALLVNGEVVDYFHGTRTAEQIEAMLAAVRTGGQYPFERCLKMSARWGKCEIRG